MQLEDDIVARPNFFTTMKNFALQQPSEDWMILEFSQLGFIGESQRSAPSWVEETPPPPQMAEEQRGGSVVHSMVISENFPVLSPLASEGTANT